MIKKTYLFIGIYSLLLLWLAACTSQSASAGNIQIPVDVTAQAPVTNDTEVVDTTVSTSVNMTETVMEAIKENSDTHDSSEDYVVESSVITQIVLNGDSIAVEGNGVRVDGSIATITNAGIYDVSGTLTDGQIVVDTQDEGHVQLILDGVEMSNHSTSPLYIANADETIILLAQNSQNKISDGSTYVFESADTDEPNATIFSKDDLTIYGTGSLVVEANYNDGIASKDGLIIASGNITVHAVDDGIRGKEYLIVKDGNVTITAGGDGLKSDEDEDATEGYITVEGGTLTITSGGDAMQALTDVLISAGTFHLTTGGGNTGSLGADDSAKGIKAGVNVTIDGGTFTINAADDAIHSNDNLVINGGTFDILTGDDGIHADATLTINGGIIDIADSYEGIESAVITINAGTISVVSSDDGINVAGGNDSSGFGGRPSRGGGGQDNFATYTGSYYLYINGGYIVVDARGDGVDANGAIEMTDGTLIVNGPTEQMNGALDHDGPFTITGGFFVAAGSAGMAQTADSSSSQNALLINFSSTLPAGTVVHIQDSNGNDVLTFTPTKQYQSIAFSSPALVSGMTYTVSYGGNASGAMSDGLYGEGVTYNAGTEYTSFTVSSIVTSLGSSRNRR